MSYRHLSLLAILLLAEAITAWAQGNLPEGLQLQGGVIMMQPIQDSDLPEELARRTRPDGTLMFSAGSIAIHVLSREFVERLTGGKGDSPRHTAPGRVPFSTAAGRRCGLW